MPFNVNFGPEDTEKVNSLGGAAWIEYEVSQDICPKLWEEKFPAGYAIAYDDSLATEHLPVVAEYRALDPSELEAIYYRIVNRTNAESCIEYIFYWNFQYLPPHSYDYEPIYAYLREGQLVRVAFDFFHYDARVLSKQPPFEICGLWHAFGALDQNPGEHLERPLVRLDNAVLGKWYNRPHPKSQFVIKQKFTDPWLVHSTFRDDDTDLHFPLAQPALENIDAYYQKTYAPKRTFSTVEALRIDPSEMNRQIMNQFLAAGYVEIREGHAIWTADGEKVRNALIRNMNKTA